ncbi:ATP-binding cassette domain-containing protein [Streptomyces platensis]|uniref:ATP-binding cassette domain-containing protein n=1 Tax=Streptomyces platensis TaxID=58346 RepID=UPI003673F391
MLSQVFFRISPGTKTALVGPSGSGKSTVLSLLERFYEPISGHILMDHEDITNIPRNQLRACIGSVRLDDGGDRLPSGLDTAVGERGSQMSGGRALACRGRRLLLCRPELLLLDEVTSQRDSANEQALDEALDILAGESTTIVIAHRLSTVVAADQIVVLAGGTVRSVGTHDELMENDSLYPGTRPRAASPPKMN